MESLPTARLLLLVDYRPEYQHGWGSKTYYTQLRLDPMPLMSANEFLQALLGMIPVWSHSSSSSSPARRQPFLLEESVRMLVETGACKASAGPTIWQARQTIQVPATVQAVLAARIDRLPPEEKGLLQTAAVIGHEVPLPLLQAIVAIPEEVLHRSLAHLQATEFLCETRLFPECEYTFKHALTHEVAYGGLLHERRRTHTPGSSRPSRPSLGSGWPSRSNGWLTMPCGGKSGTRLAYLRQAGEKAMVRSAYREAVEYFEQRSVPSRICQRHAHTRAGHRSPARPALGAPAVG